MTVCTPSTPKKEKKRGSLATGLGACPLQILEYNSACNEPGNNKTNEKYSGLSPKCHMAGSYSLLLVGAT